MDRHHMSTSAARNARRKYRKPDHRVDEHCRPRERPLLETGRRTLPPAIQVAATGRHLECAGASRGRGTLSTTGRELAGDRSGQRAAGSSQASSRVDVECPGRDRQVLRVGGQGRDQPIQVVQHVGRAARSIAHGSAVALGALRKIRGGGAASFTPSAARSIPSHWPASGNGRFWAGPDPRLAARRAARCTDRPAPWNCVTCCNSARGWKYASGPAACRRRASLPRCGLRLAARPRPFPQVGIRPAACDPSDVRHPRRAQRAARQVPGQDPRGWRQERGAVAASPQPVFVRSRRGSIAPARIHSVQRS